MNILPVIVFMVLSYSIIDFLVAVFNYVTTRDRKQKHFMKLDAILFLVCFVCFWFLSTR